jgi:hypothetical protein
MALDRQQRRFKLIVTEVEVTLLEAQWREETKDDFVEIEFRGKLLPTSHIRIDQAIRVGNFDLNQRTLV